MALQCPEPLSEPNAPNRARSDQVNHINGCAEKSKIPQERTTSKESSAPHSRTPSNSTLMEVMGQKNTTNEAQAVASYGQPFLQTHFGNLPTETREKVFINLLATPPPHAGREVLVSYHLKASHIAVLQTCRQVYLEAFEVFYGRKSYYTANARELVHILNFGCQDSLLCDNFRCEEITSLCVKDLMVKKHTPPSSMPDLLFLRWAQFFSPRTRARLIDTAYPTFNHNRFHGNVEIALRNLKNWRSLSKICLCMRVGEELQYIRFLFAIPGLERGQVNFLDDHRWVAHLQPQDRDRKTLFACCHSWPNYIDEVDVTFGQIMNDLENLYTACGASKLREGDERYVEVDVVR